MVDKERKKLENEKIAIIYGGKTGNNQNADFKVLFRKHLFRSTRDRLDTHDALVRSSIRMDALIKASEN